MLAVAIDADGAVDDHEELGAEAPGGHDPPAGRSTSSAMRRPPRGRDRQAGEQRHLREQLDLLIHRSRSSLHRRRALSVRGRGSIRAGRAAGSGDAPRRDPAAMLADATLRQAPDLALAALADDARGPALRRPDRRVVHDRSPASGPSSSRPWSRRTRPAGRWPWVSSALARFLVPTLIAPFAGLPTVRWRPEAVLRTVNAIRTVVDRPRGRRRRPGAPIQLLFLVGRHRGRRRGVQPTAPHGAPASRRPDARAAHRRQRHVERGRGPRHVRRAGPGGAPARRRAARWATLAVLAIYAAGRRGHRPPARAGRRAVGHVGAGRARPTVGRVSARSPRSRATARRPGARTADLRPRPADGPHRRRRHRAPRAWASRASGR